MRNQLWEAEERSGHVIAERCVDIVDRSFVEQCPVDGIYQAARWLYSHPDECVDCRAWEPECPTEGIFYEEDLPTACSEFTAQRPVLGRDAARVRALAGPPTRRATGDPTFTTADHTAWKSPDSRSGDGSSGE